MRKQGYFIRIDTFVPVDMKDRKKQRELLDALDALNEKGDLGGIVNHPDTVILGTSSKFQSKEIPEKSDRLDIEDAIGDSEAPTGDEDDSLGERADGMDAEDEDGAPPKRARRAA